MRTFLTAAVVAAGVAAASPSEPLKPLRAERDAFQAEVARLVDGGDFAALEKLHRSLVADDPRFPGGISKLVDYYDALSLPTDAVGTPAFAARRRSYEEWLRRSPRLHLPKVGLALLAMTEGSRVRGRGYADTVPPSAWPEFERHVAVSWSWLEKALADNPRDPEFYGQLIGVCNVRECSRAEAERWLEIASRLNPGYESTYVVMASYLLPRWHGSPEEFAQFARQSADSHPELGDLLYARIATVALLVARQLTKEMPALEWTRIRSGLTEIERRYPDAARTQHLLAAFAASYKDKGTARAAFERIGPWDPVEGVEYWKTEEYFLKCQRWAMAGSVP